MELTVKPHHKNQHPLRAILIQGETPGIWLAEIQAMKLSLAELRSYGLPGGRANSIWGCIVIPMEGRMPREIGRNSYCQRVHSLLYIPENSELSPAITDEELTEMLKGRLHVFHPAIGWVELEEPVDWEALIDPPLSMGKVPIRPEAPVMAPATVHSFHILGLPPEEVLERLDAQLFPEKADVQKGPLSFWEKLLLVLLRVLCWGLLPLFKIRLGPRATAWLQRRQKRLSEKTNDLEERNKQEVDKLLDMFRDDPEEALRYAVPLDRDGTSRGKQLSSAFRLVRRWNELTLSGRRGAGGGTVAGMDDEFERLKRQYQSTAKALLGKGDHRKAAFVYLRLLKDYRLAAQTLEEGGLYAEAASIYLEHSRDKVKAAECYEKGQLIQPAIDLYLELGKDEKAGDLYRSINRREEAGLYYTKVVNGYTENGQYLKASSVVREKMDDQERAQSLLMEGWRTSKDAERCLDNYFSHIRDERHLEAEIKRVYTQDTDERQRGVFLEVLKHAYRRGGGAEQASREIAYEIVAQLIKDDPAVAAALQSFNERDTNLTKDILKFKHSRKK